MIFDEHYKEWHLLPSIVFDRGTWEYRSKLEIHWFAWGVWIYLSD